jgi:Carboxypeptidase regulatory-like domain
MRSAVYIAATIVGIMVAAFAQSSDRKTQVAFEVKDPTGAMVGNADIRICPGPNNVPIYRQTTATGQVVIELAPGAYEISILHPWFLKFSRRIDVTTTSQRYEVVLNVAPQKLVVEVCSSCPPVQMAANPWEGIAPLPRSPAPHPAPSPTKVNVMVSDATGAAVPGALVGAVDVRVTPVGFVRADEVGHAMLRLMPGKHELRITFPGFEDYHRIIEVTSQAEVTLKAELRVGRCTECVTVETDSCGQ